MNSQGLLNGPVHRYGGALLGEVKGKGHINVQKSTLADARGSFWGHCCVFKHYGRKLLVKWMEKECRVCNGIAAK